MYTLNVYVERIRMDKFGGRRLAPPIRLERGKRIRLSMYNVYVRGDFCSANVYVREVREVERIRKGPRFRR